MLEMTLVGWVSGVWLSGVSLSMSAFDLTKIGTIHHRCSRATLHPQREYEV